MTRILLAVLLLSGCTVAGTPTPAPVEKARIDCDLIFPAPSNQ